MHEYELLGKSGVFREFKQGEGQLVRLAYREVIVKLCRRFPDRYNYHDEIAEIAKSEGYASGEELILKALSQVDIAPLKLSSLGRLTNYKEVPKEFSLLYGFLFKKADLFFIFERGQLSDRELYLPKKYREAIGRMVDDGDVAMVVIAKDMPEKAKEEVREISDRLGGTFWLNNGLLDHVDMPHGLRHYLKHGPVRVLCKNGEGTVSNALARAINKGVEEKGGFQKHQLERLMDYLVHSEKGESLKGALKVCLPVLGAIKLLHHFAPGLMHVVGGALDDIFGAILPDASQSMKSGVRKEKDGNFVQRQVANARDFASRASHAISVALTGMAFIPFAFVFGAISRALYRPGASIATKLAVGAFFGLACGIGTVGTSIAATVREMKAIKKFYHEHALPKTNYLSRAFYDSVLRIPFRVGHTIWGLPLQIGVSAAVAAVSALLYAHWLFVSGVGMLETLLGMAFAFGYTHYAAREHRKMMRRLRVPDLPEIAQPEQKQSAAHTAE